MGAIPGIHRRAALAAALAALATGAAGPGPAGALTIRAAWTRPAAAGANGAGYLTIVNSGRLADRLIGAASPAAARVSIHESRLVGSVMTMRTVDALTIPAGGSVAFSPGGLHLMLEGLETPLKVGDHVVVTLVFQGAGRRPARLAVSNGPPSPTMAGMKM